MESDSESDEYYTNPKYMPLSNSFLQTYLTPSNRYSLSQDPDYYLQDPEFNFGFSPQQEIQPIKQNLTTKKPKTKQKLNMEKLGSCRKFSGYPHENGSKFIKEFESFATLHELDEEDDYRKLAVFHR